MMNFDAYHAVPEPAWADNGTDLWILSEWPPRSALPHELVDDMLEHPDIEIGDPTGCTATRNIDGRVVVRFWCLNGSATYSERGRDAEYVYVDLVKSDRSDPPSRFGDA